MSMKQNMFLTLLLKNLQNMYQSLKQFQKLNMKQLKEKLKKKW